MKPLAPAPTEGGAGPEPSMVRGRQVSRSDGTGTAGLAGHVPVNREKLLTEASQAGRVQPLRNNP